MAIRYVISLDRGPLIVVRFTDDFVVGFEQMYKTFIYNTLPV